MMLGLVEEFDRRAHIELGLHLGDTCLRLFSAQRLRLELAACTRLLRELAPDAAAYATKHRATVGSMRKAMSVRFGSVEHDPHEYNGLLAVVAHNNTKPLMKRFIEDNLDVISLFPIVTTRSTGTVLEETFGLAIDTKVSSGPLGGDQEIGGMISKGEVDGVLFFRDPLSAHPHVDDINALMRICDVHCVATANNPVSGRAVLLWLSQLSQARVENEHLNRKLQQLQMQQRQFLS